jgi:thiamine biosynthesis lipoprotein
MPLVETLPVGEDTAQWDVWGTVARIVVTDPAALSEATALVRVELAAVDAACSRFRADSELNAACRAGRAVTVSPLLADLLAAALQAARTTDGDVDPTVGGALCNLGYDRDFAALTGRTVAPAVRVFPSPDWTAVRLHDRELRVPSGMLLDLGATAKAAAADRAAALVALRLGVGVLVALGGDIATAGPGPDWSILVRDRPGDPSCVVRVPAGAALATSSTAGRTWGRPGELVHHILDPRTGRPAPTVWRTVSVVAYSCLRANTLSTAAVIRGHDAFGLLGTAPARLVTPELAVVRVGGWPS